MFVFRKWAEVFPEEVLTTILIIVAAVALIIAIWGKRMHKLFACAYFALPF